MKSIFKLLVLSFFAASMATFIGCEKDNRDFNSPLIPTLTTNAAANISSTQAYSGGIVIFDGGNKVTARGVCWNTSHNPTTADSKTEDGTGAGAFYSYLAGLKGNTTYYVRAYATNKKGTAYGNEISFTAPDHDEYVFTSPDVSFSAISAIVRGNINGGQNGFNLIGSGVCWSTSHNPTTSDSKTNNSTYSGAFETNLTGLTPATTYFVRAYSVYLPDYTVFYGNEISFTTSIEQIISTQIGDFPGGVRYGAASFSIGYKLYIGLGSRNGYLSVKDFWEWDQTTNTWTRKANYPGTSTGIAVSFSIGTKGYIGFGNDSIDGLTNEFWEYDPSTNTWAQKASLNTPPSRGMAVGFSIGTKGYIGTGYKDSYTAAAHPGQTYQDFWEWDQATNVWTRKANFEGNARYGAVGFSIGNKGYIGTGSGDGNNMLKDFWEWDQTNDVWNKKSDFGGMARIGAVGFSIGNKGYIGTGNDNGTVVYKDYWEWDQATDVWTMKADFGGMARFGAIGYVIGNKGYIGTGSGSGNGMSLFKDFWEWDQLTNSWK